MSINRTLLIIYKETCMMTKNNIDRRLRSQIVVTFRSKSPKTGLSGPILGTILDIKKGITNSCYPLIPFVAPPIPLHFVRGTAQAIRLRRSGDTHD
jgi:hypothetical protein